MKSILNTGLQRVINLLFPWYCAVCHLHSDQNIALCTDCEATLPKPQQTCACCGKPLPSCASLDRCGQCLLHPPYYDELIAAFWFESPIRECISQFKFYQALEQGAWMSEQLMQTLQQKIANEAQYLPDYILPVPLHVARLRERGFNQSMVIAKTLSKTLKIPLLLQAVQRHKATLQQAKLLSTARKKNLSGAFSLNANTPANYFNGKHVAIVDDVVTTGTTVSQLSQLLRHNGAHKISIWCVARAL